MPGFTETILKLPILKRLYPSLRKRWAEIFWKDGFAVVRSNGALFLVNHRNFVDRQIAFYGDYEAEQTAYLTTAMGEHGCDLFLDIGANIGLYSIRAAMAWARRAAGVSSPQEAGISPGTTPRRYCSSPRMLTTSSTPGRGVSSRTRPR